MGDQLPLSGWHVPREQSGRQLAQIVDVERCEVPKTLGLGDSAEERIIVLELLSRCERLSRKEG